MFRRMPALSASTSRRTAAARWPTGTPLPIPSTRLPYADGPTRCEGRVTVALNQSLSEDDRCGGRLGYGGRRSHKDNPRSGGGEVQGQGGRGRVSLHGPAAEVEGNQEVRKDYLGAYSLAGAEGVPDQCHGFSGRRGVVDALYLFLPL